MRALRDSVPDEPDDMFDRDVEWMELAAFAGDERPGATLGVISGRCRQGKTFLLRALCEATGGFLRLLTPADLYTGILLPRSSPGARAVRRCETAYAGRMAAETFLRVFPEATFVCVHRSLPGVLADGVRTYPWGLGGSPFWSFSAGHPGDNVITIAEY